MSPYLSMVLDLDVFNSNSQESRDPCKAGRKRVKPITSKKKNGGGGGGSFPRGQNIFIVASNVKENKGLGGVVTEWYIQQFHRYKRRKFSSISHAIQTKSYRH